MTGRSKCDIDLEALLLNLIGAESDATTALGIRIAALRRRFICWRRADA